MVLKVFWIVKYEDWVGLVIEVVWWIGFYWCFIFSKFVRVWNRCY